MLRRPGEVKVKKEGGKKEESWGSSNFVGLGILGFVVLLGVVVQVFQGEGTAAGAGGAGSGAAQDATGGSRSSEAAQPVPPELVGTVVHSFPALQLAPGEADLCGLGSACYPMFEKGQTLNNLWEGEADAHIRQHRLHNEEQRLLYNGKQPRHMPKFTDYGYLKTRVPEETFARLLEFYNTPDKPRDEGWDRTNTYVNYWESPTFMKYMPADLTMKTQKDLQPVFEEWSGVPLVYTAGYGIRFYYNNSILANHVDRVETHVISGIINVDQDVDEPWALYVKGHDGVAREVTLEPGDLVLYESASVLHGRPKPMRGNYYANTFFHFMPRDNWTHTVAEFKKSMAQ